VKYDNGLLAKNWDRFEPFDQSQVRISSLLHNKLARPLGVKRPLGPLHTRDWEPMTITLQALSSVEKEELVQVRFTLRLRDQQSMWMQDGCKVYMHSYVASNGACFIVHLDYFQILPLGGRPNTKPRDHGTMNTHNCWFVLYYHVRWPAWIKIHWNNMWLRAWLHMTSHTLEGPWPNYMILKVCWDGLWTLSFWLSPFHGHGSWLVCEVALSLNISLV
jgi:hypothetical protein